MTIFLPIILFHMGHIISDNAWFDKLLRANEDETVVHFPNLDQTSILITPIPKYNSFRQVVGNEEMYRYTSIGPFVKYATTRSEVDQIHECLRVWSKLYQETNWTDKYLATSGDKVAWLHFRIDPDIEWWWINSMGARKNWLQLQSNKKNT